MRYTAWLSLLAVLAVLGSFALWGSRLAAGAKAARIELLGLASVELPGRFQLVGMVDAGEAPSDYTLKTTVAPAAARDRSAATFRLEQDQSHDWGGYLRDPVLLTITLYNPALPAPDADTVRPVRVHRYYSPIKDQNIAADSPRWRSEREGSLRWRWLEMQDSGDARWVVVLTDPARHLRLDLFAWKKKYNLDEARALLRAAAASLQPTAALAQHFEQAANVEQRVAALTEQRLAEYERLLVGLGLPRLRADEPVLGDTVAALLERASGTLTVARLIGSVALSAATPRGLQRRPEIALALKPAQYVGSGTVNGLPNLKIVMLYWDDSAGRWRASELQARTAREDEALPPLVQAVATRLTDHARAHLLRVTSVRLSPEWSDPARLPKFLSDTQAYQTDLAAGRIVAR
ncbi:MAG: hypothetical protein IPO19_03000 [Rhodoferax sp.]|nr:hypothetical protein [Rhodoferax sp.]